VSLAGLILAAGESRRMGSPKALLEFKGETFLDRLILTLRQVCPTAIVVLGHEPQRVRAGLRYADLATFVRNPDYGRGQLSSLQCGLAAVPSEAEGVMFTPVDYPAVLPSTVARVALRFRQRAPQALLVVPRAEGRRGHPVCVARELIAEFLALPPDAQARDVIHRHRDETVYLDVDDRGILEDVDDPEAYGRLTGGTREDFPA
jgi:molybdenum cofactor cytidylyltransferase